MIKSKISKSKKFTTEKEISVFDISLRTGKEEVKGKLTIDTLKKTMRVNLGRPLKDYTSKEREYEQLAVLKEIFYCFCINECRRGRENISEHIEEYKFIDEMTREDRKTIIDYLMQYDLDEFDKYKRKEKIMYYIRSAYGRICEQKKYNRLIELEAINNFSDAEVRVFKKILSKYLNIKGIRGTYIDKSKEYNDVYMMQHLYCGFTIYYVYDFLIAS